jgi:hypothetical protein
MPLMDNLGDGFIPSDSNDKYDPIVRWSRIGKSLEGTELLLFLAARTLTGTADGGLLAWITLGVNTVNNNMPQPPDQKRHVVDWHLD